MNSVNDIQKDNGLKGHTLGKRYFYKLSTNILGFVISFLTQLIIPRGLGPKNFGDFSFLTSFFNQFISILDGGTSVCFYTKVSKRPKEVKLVYFYYFFIVIIMLLATIFTIVMHLSGAYSKIWPAQQLSFVYLALFLGIFLFVIKIISGMNDAYGLTVYAELGKIIQGICGLGIIFLLFIHNKLNLKVFFLYNYLVCAILILIFVFILKRFCSFLFLSIKLTVSEIRIYAKEFYSFTHPIFIISALGMLVAIFDRWLLQVYGGSIQQGFFGLSSSISAVCCLFTAAMIPLLTREFSIAYNNNNPGVISELFRKYGIHLFTVTAFFACFVSVNAEKVTLIVGGGKFKESAFALSLMAFYPVNQTFGQFSGSLFYASGETRLYRNISVIFMLIGIPIAYFLLATKQGFGMDLGANGLAIKIIVLAFIGVNVQLCFNSRLLGVSFLRLFRHQLITVAVLLLVAFSAAKILDLMVKNVLAAFVMSSFLYTGINLLLLLAYPQIFSISRDEVYGYIEVFKRKLKFGKR